MRGSPCALGCINRVSAYPRRAAPKRMVGDVRGLPPPLFTQRRGTEILRSALAHEGVKSRPHPSPRHRSSAYDKARCKSAKAATLEPTSARAATKASGPTSEGSPEVGSGLTVAVALGLGVGVAVGGDGRRLANAQHLEAPGVLPLESGGVGRRHLDCVTAVVEPAALVQ